MTFPMAMRDAVLAIDQGTTNTKTLCVDRSGGISCVASVPVRMLRDENGGLEQSPEELWESVKAAAAQSVLMADDAGLRLCGIAISNQRETALAWHRGTGAPLGSAISWQCVRSAEFCQRHAGAANELQRKTGLTLHPAVSASKWQWMLEESELAREMQSLARDGKLCLGTVDAWLVFKLTEGASYATDHTNASRTALLNLETLEWDEELLKMFGVPRRALPRVRASAEVFGTCTALAGLQGLPVVSVAGDSHAALVAHGAVAGQVKATYGTGSSLMMALKDLPQDTGAIARTVAWSKPGETHYGLEGNIAMTGSAVQWVGEFLGLPQPVDDCVALAESVEDAAGVTFVPAMTGLGAPWWDEAARGSIQGLERGHRAAHVARAAVEAIAFQVADVFDAMQQVAGFELRELRADGGATRNSTLMQFQADVLGCEVLRSGTEELSSVGAAWLAGVTLGWWESPAAAAGALRAGERFVPKMQACRRDKQRARWREAVQRTLTREDSR